MEQSDRSSPILSILLVDSELELVPKQYWSHPAVVQNAKKRKKRPSMVLLDSTLHHSIFKDIEERNRRGRPDIVHQFLLLGLDSILNIEGRLNLYVHTRNDELITVDPSTRLPKNYNRYAGLFEELFKSGSVPSGTEPLIQLHSSMDIDRSIERILSKKGLKGKNTKILLLHQDGELDEPWTLFNKLINDEKVDHVLCLIGGFSHGDFRSKVEKHSDMKFQLPGGILKVWTVVSEILVGFRKA